MISAFFINRPVLANVLAIIIVLIGGVALLTLPVSQYPNVVPPTVQVTTTYPGASAKVVVDNVAGTTRDPVDELVELGGKTWRFVDTAGIRRRVHQTRGSDFYASLRTQTLIKLGQTN